MTDVIMEMPWHCGERDCPVGWHQANYWMQEDGTYTIDNYSDGDHQEIEEDELPSHEECQREWNEYYKDVLATGEDPLSSFFMGYSYKVRRAYVVELASSIAGTIVSRWKPKRGDWTYELPKKELAEYLLCYQMDELCEMKYGRRAYKDAHATATVQESTFPLGEYIALCEECDQVTKVTKKKKWPKGDTLMRATVHLWIEEQRERSKSGIDRELRSKARKALKPKERQ
jgi:hypothetical protein